jgi:Apea-like HEPN
MMASKGFSKGNTGQLKPPARTFLEAYRAASIASNEQFSRVLKGGGGYRSFVGGAVELTDQLTTATDALIDKANTLFGPRGASERSLSALADQIGQGLILGEFNLDEAISKLIDIFVDEGNSSFEVLLPNYLIQFKDDIRSITLGRIRAALTVDISAELRERGVPTAITQGPQFSQTLLPDGKLGITMPPRCWVVKVAAVQDNAKEEAKWLLDVAISLIRMSYKTVGPMFPMVGDIEPHPWEPWNFREAGLTFGQGVAYSGKRTTPGMYVVDKQLEATISEPSFADRANLVFDPQKGSLAERMGQGLGWLTRARQTEDRSERLLYNFTAIEALLSGSDKSAPVTQTISRNAATILTEDVADRFKTAKDIIGLYGLRSLVVHAGSRPVAWTHANFAQNLAEELFWRVLLTADLSLTHQAFIEQLSAASYGSPWPPR